MKVICNDGYARDYCEDSVKKENPLDNLVKNTTILQEWSNLWESMANSILDAWMASFPVFLATILLILIIWKIIRFLGGQ